MLTDTFENFIYSSLENTKLDPSHFYSAPRLSWDAMLKMTKQRLEKISDSDKHLFIERAMRGGICDVIERYSQANNGFCPDYDPTKEKVYINYIDMNNLYGYAMSDPLPYGGLELIEVTVETIKEVLTTPDDSEYGYYLNVDMECRKKSDRKKQRDFPMALEKMKVTEDMLPPEQIEIKDMFDIKVGEVNKLITNTLPKENYVVHYRNLKYYLSNGWRLSKVQRILQFNQKPWMKKYIGFNTQKRMQATNEADKNFYKLMINSAYGKTMENMRKRMKIRIVTNEKDFVKYASKPTYIGYKKFGKDLCAIHEKKEVIKLNKLINVGCTVLELSKLAMYKFWYDVIKKTCKEPKLLDMDSDNLTFESKENLRDIMLENKELYDLSNQPKDGEYYCPDNKKVPGKMKDEYPGQVILEFIALKPKSYAIITIKSEKCTHKGHSFNFSSNEHKDALFNKKILRHPMKKIISKNHNIVTQKSNERSISCFYDKKYVLPNQINTLPFGDDNIYIYIYIKQINKN